jgi:hypothetical protein
MTFIVSSQFIKVLGYDDVDLEVKLFFSEDLEKIGKTIFQSRAEMKKIVGKISSK